MTPMRLNEFEQSELDSLWDELEDAEDAMRHVLQTKGRESPEYLEALSEVHRLRLQYVNAPRKG